MSPSSVEHLLTQKVRLLARRESPAIDQELETYAKLHWKYSSSGKMV
jgi:hypothetical protein